MEAEMAEVESGEESAVPECLSSFVDRGSLESHRYFLARRTLLEMLRDRGFPVPDDELALTLPTFRAKFGDKPKLDDLRVSLSIPCKGSPPKKLLGIFFGPEPFKLSTLREVYSAVKQENLTNLVLVLQSKMTSKARDGIKEISKIEVEMFQITELLVNMTKQVLMPKHELLTTDEKQDLLKKYNVGESQDRGCDFFLWHDPELSERTKAIINHLKMDNKKLQREISKLKKYNSYKGAIDCNDLLEDVNNSVTIKLRDEICSLNRKFRVVMVVIVFTWIVMILRWLM